MDEMKKIRLVKRIFEASNTHNLALQAIDHRINSPGTSGGMKRSIKTILLRILSILILATIVLTPERGLGAGAARQAERPAAPSAPTRGTTTRVSVSSDGSQGDSESVYPSISVDGRYVLFDSLANNLVSGDTNQAWDVFLHDLQTGSTERVSLASDGSQGNDSSWTWKLSISADGRYVAFQSSASNLVSGDTNGWGDVFVRDRESGSTELVSVSDNGEHGNGASNYPSISTDGRYVAFTSSASNLVKGDTNGWDDVFVHDRQTSSTTRVSVSSNGEQGDDGWSGGPSISTDGRYVAFTSSASNLVSGDFNHCYDESCSDIFVHDQQTGITERVSVSSNGDEGNSNSTNQSISADGRYIAFYSYATNLVSGDTNGGSDIFVHDRQSATTTRISVVSDGSQGNGESWFPSISADGRYVAFFSVASNLVSEDTNNAHDVFVHDRQIGSTERASVANDGSQGNDSSKYPSISTGGRYVAFQSIASNLVSGDTNDFCDTDGNNVFEDNCPDVFVRDRGERNFINYLPVTQINRE